MNFVLTSQMKEKANKELLQRFNILLMMQVWIFTYTFFICYDKKGTAVKMCLTAADLCLISSPEVM